MRKIIKKLINYLFTPLVISDYFRYKKKSKNDGRFDISFKNIYPCIKDKTVKTGFDRHYVYHTSWAARKLAEIKPGLHIDISSSLYFVGITSAFIPIKFYDYRPADIKLSNMESDKANISALPFLNGSVESLSCMHVIEHIGLGRYGDDIDSSGDIKAISELKRVLSRNGSLLLVVPVGGNARIEFNAHRIYTYNQIIEYLADFKLKEFALIPEKDEEMIYGQEAIDKSKIESYACGCFWFIK